MFGCQAAGQEADSTVQLRPGVLCLVRVSIWSDAPMICSWGHQRQPEAVSLEVTGATAAEKAGWPPTSHSSRGDLDSGHLTNKT